MYVEKFKNNGTDYLRLVKSQRILNSKGVKTATKTVVYNIGPLSRFDDGRPDYVERLKQSFKNGKPLIPALQQFCTDPLPKEHYDVHFEEGDPDCIGHPKLFSQVLIERILEELGMIYYFQHYKQYTRIQYDLLGFFRLLVYGRILNPASKLSTARQNDDYYLPVVDAPYIYNIYDTLDFIYDWRKSITRKLNKSMTSRFGRSTNVIFYDVTNFFFEIGRPDDDEELEDGSIKKGLRKNGVCKEERTLPIVQMGMFMDEQGFPISIETFPGNTLDHLTMIDACRNTVDDLGLSRFIFVADRGLFSTPNILHLLDHNNGYIVSRSIKKNFSKDRDWILSDEGYAYLNEDFRYKSRTVKYKAKDPDDPSRSRTIVEKQVVYWSRSFYEREKAEKKSFIEFIEKLRDDPKSFRVSSIQAKNIRKYLRKDMLNTETGEILESSKVKAMLDEDKINKEIELMGYYLISTSEVNMDDLSIIDTYHRLSRIEDQFHTMKGTLETRPVFVRSEEHIYSHLFINMISVIVMRVIQEKVLEYQKKNSRNRKDVNLWETGLSAERIQTALQKWTVDILPEDYYRFNYLDDPDLKLILDAFDIKIPLKLFRRADLKKIKSEIKI
mgnify:FL=1